MAPRVMTGRACSIAGCRKPRGTYATGWCAMHYQRARRYGDPLAAPPTIVERVWARIERTPGGCWLWTGKINKDGYGIFWADGREWRAHRFVYELLVEPIPDGLELDHVWERGCRHRHCVSPLHLEPVTPEENKLRSSAPPAQNATKETCAHGHPFDEANTYRRGDGTRGCRACHREAERRRRNG